MQRTLVNAGLFLSLAIAGLSSNVVAAESSSESWGIRAYDAAVLLDVTGFPDCHTEPLICQPRRWTVTAPAMRTADSEILVAAPAGALAGALRVSALLPGDPVPHEATQVPVPSRLGVAVLVIGGERAGEVLGRLPPVPGPPDGTGGEAPSPRRDAPVWILSRSTHTPHAPAQPYPGWSVSPALRGREVVASGSMGIEFSGPEPQGGGFVCDDRGTFLGLMGRAGDRWVLIPEDRVGRALVVAAGAVRAGTVDQTTGRASAAAILAAWEAYSAFRATGPPLPEEADVMVDEGETTLEPAAQKLLASAYCQAQGAWRGLVDARADRNADHVDLLREYWEWVQFPSFRGLLGCLAQETGTTVLLSCFACHPPTPHRATRRSPSPLFTEDLYYRLVVCDEEGLRRFCTECLLYERYEDLLIHSGLEDDWLRRVLPFVRRIDLEVFGHRLEPVCEDR